MVAWSDSCGGQNRNIKTAVALLSLVGDSTLPYSIIAQKFLESGHSFLPNDADFSDIEKRKKFQPQIYHPQEWCNVMTEARSKSKPFEVVTMQPDDFFSTKPLELGITNGKRDTNKDKVNWLKMRQIQYRRSDPKSLFYKCSHSTEEDWKQVDHSTEEDWKQVDHSTQEDWKQVDLEKRGSCVNLTHIPLPKLYDRERQISQPNKNDLLSLLPYILPMHHEFYSNLPSTSKAREDDVDGFPDTLDFETELSDKFHTCFTVTTAYSFVLPVHVMVLVEQ